MRKALLIAIAIATTTTVPVAAIEPETISTSTMATPQSSWFMVKNGESPTYIFNSADGQMQGLLALSRFTPAVEANVSRGEFYAAESYYSRGVRGERTDILAIYDMATLTPKAEVAIPKKFESAYYRRHLGLLDNERHVVIFNMTPGQSVSIVDVESHSFAGEIATPGCSTIMPASRDGFLMICGDGALQLITLDDSGKEASRTRSRAFFSVQDDPIGDKPVRTEAGWLFQSFGGEIYEASVDAGKISVSEPWSLLSDSDVDEGWRIGSAQPMSYHLASGLLYTMMHVSNVDLRDDPATEVWVFDRQTRRRIYRFSLDQPATAIATTSEEHPTLLLLGVDYNIGVFDGLTFVKRGSIREVGPAPLTLHGF